MRKQTIRSFKHGLRDKHLKILNPGERHKDFTYPVFVELPKEWVVTPHTPLEVNSLRTPVCYAGDVANNDLVPYWLVRMDWENDHVIVRHINSKSEMTFYADAVALIPIEIIPDSWRLKLIHDDVIIDNDKAKRKLRRKGEIAYARGSRSPENSRSANETHKLQTNSAVGSRQEVVGKEEETRSVTELQAI